MRDGSIGSLTYLLILTEWLVSEHRHSEDSTRSVKPGLKLRGIYKVLDQFRSATLIRLFGV